MVVLMHQDDIELVIEKANAKHVSEIESTFLTKQTIRCYKGERFEKKKRIFDVRTHFRPIETFQRVNIPAPRGRVKPTATSERKGQKENLV